MKEEGVLVTSKPLGQDTEYPQFKETKLIWLMVSEGSIHSELALWSWSVVGYCGMVERHGRGRHDGREWQPGSIKKERDTVRGFPSKDIAPVANSVPWAHLLTSQSAKSILHPCTYSTR